MNYLSGIIAAALCISTTPIAQANVMALNTMDVETDFDVVTVTGTKTRRQINEIAASVTSITDAQIDAIGANNIRDLLRYEPGVSVEGNGRFGLSSFNIRGINGDRVLILVDGVPIADEFSFGPNLSARRDFVDIDLVKSVDIIRGPASTLYGSDAIGGVVAFHTKDPADLIDNGDTFAGRVKLGYVSQSEERYINGMLASVTGNFQWLLNATSRKSSEVSSYFDDNLTGENRNSTNPQSNHASSVLAKVIYQSNPVHRFKLVAETFSQDSDTNIQSDVSRVVRGAINLTSTGLDSQERSRFSAQYLYQPNNQGHFKRVNLQAFHQDSKTEQHSALSRVSLVPNSSAFSRTRDSFFEQRIQGMNIQLDHEFILGAQHYLIYGVSVEKTDSEGLREGLTQNIDTGEIIPEFSVFPARDFPLSELSEKSLFIQDEIQFFDGKLLVSPGVRYDTFTLTPELDPIFITANPNVDIATFDDGQLSKKLGAIYQLENDYSVWLQYAEGFRIPPMDDVNVGFTNFAGRYTSLANPHLTPESVVSTEIGLRGFTDAITWSLSAYQNDYENFIESLSFVGISAAGFTLFQAINLDDVEVSGVEGSLTWLLGESADALENWQFKANFSVQDSKNKQTSKEIESILPSQVVMGIQYNDYSDPWRTELAMTYTESAQLIADNDTTDFFEAPNVVTIDLLGHYQVNKNIRINAGIFNITDKKFWLASEVSGQSATSNVNSFTQPGRNASVNAVINF